MQASVQIAKPTASREINNNAGSANETALNTTMFSPKSAAPLESGLVNMLRTSPPNKSDHTKDEETGRKTRDLSPGTYTATAVASGIFGVMFGRFCLQNLSMGNYGMAALEAALAIYCVASSYSDWRKGYFA